MQFDQRIVPMEEMRQRWGKLGVLDYHSKPRAARSLTSDMLGDMSRQ